VVLEVLDPLFKVTLGLCLQVAHERIGLRTEIDEDAPRARDVRDNRKECVDRAVQLILCDVSFGLAIGQNAVDKHEVALVPAFHGPIAPLQQNALVVGGL